MHGEEIKPNKQVAKTGNSVSLLIVIVNYRTPGMTIDCLGTLAEDVKLIPGCHVAVSDNCSGDDSVHRIEQAVCDNGWGDWVTVLAQPENGGFSYGNNRAIEKWPGAEYVLLLNSDTLVEPESIKYCYDLMQADETVGVMSCRLLNKDGSLQIVARRFPTPARQVAVALGLPWRFPKMFHWAVVEDVSWDHTKVKRDVDWVGGAFMFLRGKAITKVGMLDEDFFFYGEDIEICHRVQKAGWRCHYDPAVCITHLGGGSSEDFASNGSRFNRMSWKARYLFQRKCYGWWAAAMLRMVDFNVVLARTLVSVFKGMKSRAYEDNKQVLKLLWELRVNG